MCGGEVLSEKENFFFYLPTYHIHQHILSTTGCCLAPVSPCPHPPPSSPPTFPFFTFAASVIFTLSPFFDPLADIDEFPSAAQDLVKKKEKKSWQESFQSKNSAVILMGVARYFEWHCIELL